MLAEFPVFPILLSLDLDATRTFYHEVLGLEIAREDEDDRIVFRCGGGTQLVVTKSTIGTLDSQTQMAWRVPDIHAAIADLRARGVRIEEYEAPDPVTTDGVADMGHSWAAWFIDPSRNVLAIVQPKGDAAARIGDGLPGRGHPASRDRAGSEKPAWRRAPRIRALTSMDAPPRRKPPWLPRTRHPTRSRPKRRPPCRST